MEIGPDRAAGGDEHYGGVAQRGHVSVDAAMGHLVRLALNEGWSRQTAAELLVQLVDGDLRVLRRARAQVVRATRDRATTPLTDRALRTLDSALRDTLIT